MTLPKSEPIDDWEPLETLLEQVPDGINRQWPWAGSGHTGGKSDQQHLRDLAYE